MTIYFFFAIFVLKGGEQESDFYLLVTNYIIGINRYIIISIVYVETENTNQYRNIKTRNFNVRMREWF